MPDTTNIRLVWWVGLLSFCGTCWAGLYWVASAVLA